MQEIVEIGRATQDELRDDLRELFQGAIRLTLEMVLEEEPKDIDDLALHMHSLIRQSH